MRSRRDEGADTEVARLLRRAGVGTYTSVREFARNCDVAHETVRRLLRQPKDGQARRPPTRRVLERLAAGLDIPLNVLEAAVLTDQGYEQAVTGVGGVESILAQLRDMSSADRRTVLAELAQEIARDGNDPSAE